MDSHPRISRAVLRLRRLLSGATRPDAVEALRAGVDRFRDLVRRNNRVLELMADAEEKLGDGDGVDDKYLLWLDAELAETVHATVRDLSKIAPKHQVALDDAFRRVRSHVSDIVEMRPPAPDSPLCIDLSRVGGEHASLLGEKMAQLAELRSRLDAPVPSGFVVTASAFRHFVAASPRLERLLVDASAPQANLTEASEAILACLAGLQVPRDVEGALKSSLRSLGRRARLAVRSSAIDEDCELSFAGIHASEMNVPRGRVIEAYRRVVASLFAERALVYRRSHDLPIQDAAMAVGCMRMVPPVASGVLYTIDPSAPASDNMLITAAWGHGATVMQGGGTTDRFLVGRHPPHRAVEAAIAVKPHQLIAASDAGLRRVSVAPDRQRLPSVDDAGLEKLANIALAVERHMRCPQEIEWTIDEHGAAWILQTSPLRTGASPVARSEVPPEAMEGHPVLFRGRGTVASRGVGAGPVFMVSPETTPQDTPPGSVLVTRSATPELSRLLPSANGLVADSGSPAGHLAALAREYRVPTIVSTEIASRVLEPGTDVTVDAVENAIYAGRVEALLRSCQWQDAPRENVRELRVLRNMLRLVTPLTLLEPASRGFKPKKCSTYHDIVRFAHEKAVTSLSDLSALDRRSARRHVRRVTLDIPLGLSLLDLGGGVASDAPPGEIGFDQITCAPLAVLLKGLAAPGVWDTRPAGMDLATLMSSVTQADTLAAPDVRHNLAIASSRHLHLSLFLGYHFNVIDCYLGESAEDSYLLFRFVGGASVLARRVRRVELLREILSRYDFAVERAGDLLLARLHAVSPSTMERRLYMTGRLIGFTRQLDVHLRNEEITRAKVDEFMAVDSASSSGPGGHVPHLP